MEVRAKIDDNNTMHKTMLKFLFSLLIFSAAAKAEGYEIEELTNGTCWMREEEKNLWHVASFASGQALRLNTDAAFMENINQEVKRALAHYGVKSFPASSVDVVIQCNPESLDVSVSVVNSKKYSVCMLGKVDKESKFSVKNIYPNPNNYDGNCDRTRHLTLGLSTSNIEKLKEILKSDKWNKLVTDLRDTRSDLLHISLSDSYRFREHEFRNLLLKDEELKSVLTHVDYDYFQYYVGNTKLIKTGKISGF
jgi:hypothetical protein